MRANSSVENYENLESKMLDHEVAIHANDYTAKASVVSEEMFGLIQAGWQGVSAFEDQAEALGIGSLRWPGGNISETRPEVFGLSIPDLFDATNLFSPNPNRDRPGLSEMMDYAIELEIPFSLILPTARYADDVSFGVEELVDFLKSLLRGDFGEVPSDFTLEIGNEYYSIAHFASDPSSYGKLANEFIKTIREVTEDVALNPYDVELSIAVQVGKSLSDDELIRSSIEAEAMEAVDTLIVHALPINHNNLISVQPDSDGLESSRFDRVDAILDQWREVEPTAEDIGVFLSAWNIGAAATDPDDVNLAYQDYGARGLGTALELFSGFSSIGADAAAAWGANVGNLNRISEGSGANVELSHVGQLIQWMSGSLVDLRYLSEFEEGDRSDEYFAHSFGTDGRIVTYLVSNDLLQDSLNVDLSFLGLTGLEVVSARQISTVIDSSFGGDPNSIEARLFEKPIVADITSSVVSNGDSALGLTFSNDYQLIELTVSYDILGTDGPDTMQGTRFDDSLVSGAGADNVSGGNGNDSIESGAGDDRVNGDAGNDLITTGDGNDVVWAGLDNDRIFAGKGEDRIFSGNGDDSIQAGPGNDYVSGAHGNDDVRGEEGDDLLELGAGDDVAYGGAGNDQIFGDVGFDVVFGGDGSDLLFGGRNADNLHGEEGADTIYGDEGLDRLFGGDGSDTLFGGADNDALFGQIGDDFLFSEEGDDRVFGGSGNDIANGGDGNDTIFGNSGFDEIIGGKGNDILWGNYNADTFVFRDGDGQDVIKDFDANNLFELIDLNGVSSVSTYADISSRLVDTETGALLYLNFSDQILFEGVWVSDLSESDFIFGA